MTSNARRLVLLFTLVGLLAASTSLYVHSRLLAEPDYTSFCDINATFSCTDAYLSRYGSVLGIPVALFGVIWFVFVGILVVGFARPGTSAHENLAGYLFAFSTVGLAVVLYLGYAAFFILKAVCLLCLTTYVAVIGLFWVSGVSTSFPMTTLPRRALRDLKALVSSPLALAVTVLFLAGAASAMAFFPRGKAVAVAPSVLETPSASQQSDFDRWYASAPRTIVPVSNEGAVVLIVKFTDYQCPACGQTFLSYRPILAKYEAQYPGAVRLVSKDFPLDTKCNPALARSVHSAACDAAVAVRLARPGHRDGPLEEWLYANQDSITAAPPAAAAELVRKAASNIGHVENLDAGYASAVEGIKADVALAQLLNVRVTPTFFINGIKVEGGLQPALFDSLVDRELKKAGKAKP